MASPWIWRAYRGVQTAISAGLDALGAGTTALGSAIDNTSNRDLYADWEMAWTWGTAPTYDAAAMLAFYPSIDGTNYATVPGAATYRIPYGAWRGAFDRRFVNTAQRATLSHQLLTPGLLKPAILNSSDQAFSASGHTLKYNPYGLMRNAGTPEYMQWSSYAGVQTVFTTELDTLAANATVTSAAIDNTTTRYTHADFELVCQYATSPTTWGGYLALTILASVDGTNYTTAAHAGLRGGMFDPWVDSTTAQRQIVTHVPLPPALFKVFLVHTSHEDTQTDPVFVASGNTLKYNPYTLEMTT